MYKLWVHFGDLLGFYRLHRRDTEVLGAHLSLFVSCSCRWYCDYSTFFLCLLFMSKPDFLRHELALELHSNLNRSTSTFSSLFLVAPSFPGFHTLLTCPGPLSWPFVLSFNFPFCFSFFSASQSSNHSRLVVGKTGEIGLEQNNVK